MSHFKLAIIYYTRSHSLEKLAHEIAKGSEMLGVKTKIITCQEAKEQLNLLEEVDGIVFGSPTYFGSLAAEMKLFFEGLVEIWLNKKWRNKIAAGFTHSSSPSGDKLMTLMEIMVFAMQNGMIWVGPTLLPGEKVLLESGEKELVTNQLGAWLGLMAFSDPRKNLALGEEDFLTARLFGKRIASAILALDKK